MNVFDYFFSSVKNWKKNFVLNPKDTITFEDLYQDSLKIASYLNLNFGKGQNVILLGQNSAFFIKVYLGILKSGNHCVPLNIDIEQKNFDHILRLTESKMVFSNIHASSRLKFEPNILLIDESLLSDFSKPDENCILDNAFPGNQLAEIIFTSGSTGIPKGVMISHQNIIANTDSIIQYLNLSSNDVACVVLPFSYCYGLSILHTHLKVGASIVLNNTFYFLGSVIDSLKNFKCTGFSGVPSHFQLLLKKSQSFRKEKFPDLRYVTQAGGRMHNVFIVEFAELFPEIEFFVMYGQTEATARLSYLPPDLVLSKLGSIGKGIPGVILKLVNKNGQRCKPNEQGELIAKGENIMLGYYKDVNATKKTIRKGWLFTGDLGCYDEDGYIYLVGRIKEILKVRGKRVSPKEIEEVILSVNKVVDCVVNSIYDEIHGEAINANIVIQDLNEETEIRENILTQCKAKLAAYKIPNSIKFYNKMNLKPSGKKI